MSNRRSAKSNRGISGKSAVAAKARSRNDECASASNSQPRRVNVNDVDPAEFNNLRAQLTAYNLEQREVEGDGNCLFRSIADQLDGSQRSHMRYRREVCEYMLAHQEDFEAFIDFDDAEGNARTFDEYIRVLQRPGTYGDQLSIVAFARLYKLVVVIHQYGLNVWRVDGTAGAGGAGAGPGASSGPVRQLHILYHPQSDHYDSLRRIGDHSDKPTSIFIVAQSNGDAQSNAGSQKQKQKAKAAAKSDWREEQELREQLALVSYAESHQDQDASLGDGVASQSRPGGHDDAADCSASASVQTGQSAPVESELEEQLLQLQIAEIENAQHLEAVTKAAVSDSELGASDDEQLGNGKAGEDAATSDRDADPQRNAASSGKRSKQQQQNSRALQQQKRLEKKKRAEQRHRERIVQTNDAASGRPGSGRTGEPRRAGAANEPPDVPNDAAAAQLFITDANIITI